MGCINSKVETDAIRERKRKERKRAKKSSSEAKRGSQADEPTSHHAKGDSVAKFSADEKKAQKLLAVYSEEGNDDVEVVDLESGETTVYSGYKINRRDVSMRPKAAKGERKPEVVRKGATSEFSKNVKNFEKEVDKLMGVESGPEAGSKSTTARPKAAKGARTPMQIRNNTKPDKKIKGSTAPVRPQLTVAGLVTPQNDQLAEFMERQIRFSYNMKK